MPSPSCVPLHARLFTTADRGAQSAETVHEGASQSLLVKLLLTAEWQTDKLPETRGGQDATISTSDAHSTATFLSRAA